MQKIRAMLGQNMRIKCGSVEEFQGQEVRTMCPLSSSPSHSNVTLSFDVLL